MTFKANFEMEFTSLTCYKCNCIFYVPLKMYHNLKETKDIFYCPVGHEQMFRKSTSEILQEKLDQAEFELQSKSNQLSQCQNQLRERNKPKRRAKRINTVNQ